MTLLERVVREGLELLSLDPGRPAAGVKAHDPRPARELEAAEREAREAQNARRQFLAEHRADLKAERDRAEMQRVRDALAGEDPERLREALKATA